MTEAQNLGQGTEGQKVASKKPVVNGENGSQIRWIGPEKKVDITVNFA